MESVESVKYLDRIIRVKLTKELAALSPIKLQVSLKDGYAILTFENEFQVRHIKYLFTL